MTVFAVGQATIARIEETYLPVYKPKDLFPEWSEELLQPAQELAGAEPLRSRLRPGQTQRA